MDYLELSRANPRCSGEKMEGNRVSDAWGIQRTPSQQKPTAEASNRHARREGTRGGGGRKE